MRTREAKINNTKLSVYKKVLRELYEKFDGVEVYIKERIKELSSEKKLLAKEVIYLFMNNYDNF